MRTMEAPGQKRQYRSKQPEAQVRTHPFAAAIALALLFAALPVGGFFGYLSWTRTIQLEAANGGRIAPQPFTISEVSGHLTAAAVTDERQVAAGGNSGRTAD